MLVVVGDGIAVESTDVVSVHPAPVASFGTQINLDEQAKAVFTSWSADRVIKALLEVADREREQWALMDGGRVEVK